MAEKTTTHQPGPSPMLAPAKQRVNPSSAPPMANAAAGLARSMTSSRQPTFTRYWATDSARRCDSPALYLGVPTLSVWPSTRMRSMPSSRSVRARSDTAVRPSSLDVSTFESNSSLTPRLSSQPSLAGVNPSLLRLAILASLGAGAGGGVEQPTTAAQHNATSQARRR